MPVLMALGRNLLYGVFGFGLSLLFLALWEKFASRRQAVIIAVLLLFAYCTGSLATFVVNQIIYTLFSFQPEGPQLVILFGGALNFSLVILVWCGFYLSMKQGLKFQEGIEERITAEAIASISNLTVYPEFIALEKLGKISLLPISKISLVKASGDYIELFCEGETYLKRETFSNFEKLLNPKMFQRVHRSAIVNLNEVSELHPKGRGDYLMMLNSDESVACSRTYMNELKERLDVAI